MGRNDPPSLVELRTTLPARVTREARISAIEAASRGIEPTSVTEADEEAAVADHIIAIARRLEQYIWEPIDSGPVT